MGAERSRRKRKRAIESREQLGKAAAVTKPLIIKALPIVSEYM
jgi:hypothetical protein